MSGMDVQVIDVEVEQAVMLPELARRVVQTAEIEVIDARESAGLFGAPASRVAVRF
jgi:hypothetical protein